MRSQLRICDERAYFFAGAHGPLAGPVRDAVTAVLDVWDTTGWQLHETEADAADRCAERLAALVGCDAARVALATCTSDAMNIAAATVLARWRRSGSPPANVVLHHQSHAASTYGFLNAVRLGERLELRVADPEPGEAADAALARLVDPATIAVVTTHVSNWDGERLDLAAFAARFSDRAFALLTDAAQSAGAIPLDDVVRVCDFVGMPAYKFLLGPSGVGFLVVGDQWVADPGPPSIGWAGTTEPLPIKPWSVAPAATAAAFRLGIPNYLGLAGATAGLDLLLAAGTDRVAARIEQLTGVIITGLDGLGLALTTPRDWARRAGVLTVSHPDPEAAMRALARVGIDVGVERTEIRVDVHAYNDESDIERLVGALGRYDRG